MTGLNRDERARDESDEKADGRQHATSVAGQFPSLLRFR
jgi:hypothetical protein